MIIGACMRLEAGYLILPADLSFVIDDESAFNRSYLQLIYAHPLCGKE
jgi:hypothetical protein